MSKEAEALVALIKQQTGATDEQITKVLARILARLESKQAGGGR